MISAARVKQRENMSSILKPKSHHHRPGAPPPPHHNSPGAAAATTTTGSKSKKLFPQKLWDLINDRRYHFCLRWSEDGQLVYLNRDEFEEAYLKTAENQFHTQKSISFVRQMNMYGFRKVDDCYYENDNFKRDCEHLLKNMIRKHPTKSSPDKLELSARSQAFSYHHSSQRQHHQNQSQQQQQQQQHQQQHQQAQQQARINQFNQVTQQQIQQALQLQQLQQQLQQEQQASLQSQQNHPDLDPVTLASLIQYIAVIAALSNR